MDKNHNLLIIGTVWPEPNSSAAGSRMMQFIELFQHHNWEITFASTASLSDYMFDLNSINIEQIQVELNNNSFDDFIKKLNPTIVLFDRYLTEEKFGWRVSENCPDALRVIETVDLHCLRLARQKAVKENRTFTTDDLISDYAKREIASIYRCDLSLMISSYEMDLLTNFFKVDSSLLLCLPFMLPSIDDEQKNDWNTFESREHFISIGNFLHEPNWDAVKYLKAEIWPLIRKQLPQAQLHIYGAYPSKKVADLNNINQGFIVKGRAESATEVMSNAKVCLAPLRFGAGQKGKLIDSMITGTPNVTTAIGAESMHDNFPWNGSIENTPQKIANAAVELYTNKNKWNTAQENGVKIINKCFDKNEIGKLLISSINNLYSNLEKHRLNNFTGAMLMHHSQASTKYMSRWIEIKNKATN